MKPLLWCLGLLITVVAGDRLMGMVLQSLNEKSQFRYARLYSGHAAADYLLVGNSRGLAFFQPYIEEITGQKSFNLSYNGLPAALAKVLVADYLERYPAATVLIDITLCDRPNKELTAGFTTFSNCSPRLDTLIKAQAPDAWWGSKVSALFRYNNEIFQRSLFYRNRLDTDWLIDRQIAAALAATVPLDTFPLWVQPDLVRDLAETIQMAQQANAPVHLVIGPYYPGMARDFSHLAALKAAVEQKTGLVVHDYSQVLSDVTEFGDLMHPNKKGAKHFMDLLQKDGLFSQK